MQAMEISRTGLDVEWRRLEVIAQNLANANSSGPAGRVYQALRLVSGPRFGTLVSDETGAAAARSLAGVAVYRLEADGAAPRRVHEPGNPNADADGFVSYPAVDHAAQMTLMVQTARAYEANIVAMTAARQMYSKALDLGRNG
jgi:flagellar basal-body rod protein FlgC